MRQYVYTCCRCGKEERTPIDTDDPPIAWARVTFERIHTVDDKTAHTTLTTHACGACAVETLVFLEKVPRKSIDDAFDHGGGS